VKIKPRVRATLRAHGGRRVVIEGFDRHAPAFIVVTGNGCPEGAWLSPRELRRLSETVRKILK
jgi:hypothetical protein